jgi:hypothetical protein
MNQFNLLTTLADFLEEITTANGYQTNAGSTVLIDPEAVDADALTTPCLRLFEQESVPEGKVPGTTRCKIRTTFVVEGVQHLNGTATHLQQAHALVQDICNAIFGGQVRFYAQVVDLSYEGHRILPRSPGSKSIVVQVRGSHMRPEVFAKPI